MILGKVGFKPFFEKHLLSIWQMEGNHLDFELLRHSLKRSTL
jgi:hypothetical protein